MQNIADDSESNKKNNFFIILMGGIAAWIPWFLTYPFIEQKRINGGYPGHSDSFWGGVYAAIYFAYAALFIGFGFIKKCCCNPPAQDPMDFVLENESMWQANEASVIEAASTTNVFIPSFARNVSAASVALKVIPSAAERELNRAAP